MDQSQSTLLSSPSVDSFSVSGLTCESEHSVAFFDPDIGYRGDAFSNSCYAMVLALTPVTVNSTISSNSMHLLFSASLHMHAMWHNIWLAERLLSIRVTYFRLTCSQPPTTYYTRQSAFSSTMYLRNPNRFGWNDLLRKCTYILPSIRRPIIPVLLSK